MAAEGLYDTKVGHSNCLTQDKSPVSLGGDQKQDRARLPCELSLQTMSVCFEEPRRDLSFGVRKKGKGTEIER